jgi:hypothetical protein
LRSTPADTGAGSIAALNMSGIDDIELSNLATTPMNGRTAR